MEWNPKTMKKSKIHDFALILMKFCMDEFFFAMCDFLDDFWKNMTTYNNTSLLRWNPNSWKILKSINLLQFQWNLAWMSFFAICDFWDGFWNNMITYNNTLLFRWNLKSWKNLKSMILHWFQWNLVWITFLPCVTF